MTIREVARADVVAALERAVRYRREMAIAAGAPPGNIRERIDAIPHGTLRPVGTDGWVEIGVVHDDLVSAVLQVQWHPASDRVRIDRPTDPAAEPDRDSGIPALSRNLYGPAVYQAMPGYRYFLDSQEYTPQQAERIAAKRDTVAGWTWRRTDAEP
jgi:hypothetical protein